MSWPWADRALLREQLKAAEARASAAEAALASERVFAEERRESLKLALAEKMQAYEAVAIERTENRRQERHLTSMWLRHQKSYPLPPTAEEKAEAKVEAEEAQKRPIPFTDVEFAMMEANRRDAALIGISAEDADKDFMKNRHMFSDD